MGRPNATRRHCLRALGLASIGGLAGCSSDSAGDDTGGTTTDDGDGPETEDGRTPASTDTDTLSPTTTLTPATSTPSETTSTPTSAESTTSTEASKLAADDGDMADSFGTSVAVSEDGTTAIIGANADEDPNGDNAGSAYVFTDSDGSWSQATKLTADDGDGGDSFGASVALTADGTTAVIGADGDEDPNGEDSVYGGAGSAYVFEESDDTWSQSAKLAANDGDGGDSFGSSVAVSDDGTTAVVGANNDEDPNGDGAGSAYVFTDSDGSWSQQAKLFADDGDYDDRFGDSVALSDDGTTAVIGAYDDEDPNGVYAGSAYVFTDSGGSWSQQAKLTADDGTEDDWFGKSVTVSADASTAIVGAPEVSRGGDGAAYVFEESDGTWSQQAKLTGGDDIASGSLGRSAAISNDGTIAVVGAYTDDTPNPDYVGDHGSAGTAYVFGASDGSWSQQAKLTAEDGDEDDEFGWAVGLSDDGTTAVIGAHRDEDPNGSMAGSAYLFEESDNTWSQTSKLVADDGEEDDQFGESVAVSGDSTTAIVGANQVRSSFADPGSTYVYDV